MVRGLVLTGATHDYRKIADLSVPTIARYAAAQGCAFRHVIFPEWRTKEETFWRKFDAIREGLSEGLPVVWIDSDVYVFRDAPDLLGTLDVIEAQVECADVLKSRQYAQRLIPVLWAHKTDFPAGWRVPPETVYWNCGAFSIWPSAMQLMKGPSRYQNCGTWPEQNWMCLRTRAYNVKVINRFPEIHGHFDGNLGSGFEHCMGGDEKEKISWLSACMDVDRV